MMKSKSFDLKESSAEKLKLHKSFDFVGLYKTAAESNVNLSENRKSGEGVNKENNFRSIPTIDAPKHARSPHNKKKRNKYEPLDISQITIDGQSLSTPAGRSSPVNHSRIISTPSGSQKKQNPKPKVKSIMKNPTVTDDSMESTSVDYSSHKPKKRNKSVSFMLDDNEEVAVKKTKSEESVKVDKTKVTDVQKKKFKKYKKHLQAEKENKTSNSELDQNTAHQGHSHVKKSKIKHEKPNGLAHDSSVETVVTDSQPVTREKNKKLKKIKKQRKVDECSEPTENNETSEEQTELKLKKLKKKKRHAKSVQAPDTPETDGEPITKSRKKDAKADVIAEDLENLKIGDNAHTLTNLLDEMTVVDKDKKKKNKHRRKKDKGQKTASVSSSETADLEKIEEGKEKVKWKKRKWNKDKKGDVDEVNMVTSVIVENLPLQIMISYKKLLADHFGKLGLIKKIGIAEVYPSEEPKPVFTTTICFYSEGAASKALEEDNSLFEGSRIRIKQPLPPTQTTLVVRSYAELTEQNLSSVFTSAGRIRNIRHLVKGRKSMATAFIEFDGPDAVERAIKMAEDAKIGAKKIHVSKFELRTSKNIGKKGKSNAESENEGDSEDSND